MTDVNKKALRGIATRLRQMATRDKRVSECELQSIADTIREIVEEESDVLTTQAQG